MNKMLEIVWHGRGGQGAKTAATMLAAMAIHEGKFSQGAPEYGPERQGAPMKGYTRISATPIRIHSGIAEGDVAVVLDATLLKSVDILGQLKKGGTVIVNTTRTSEEIRKDLKAPADVKVFVVDATGIAIAEMGKNFPNTPLLGSLVKISGILKIETVMDDIKAKLGKKLSQQMLDGNFRAVKRGYDEVK
ncbi:MAG: 2-oxoacid:acceptor oxidoreductase family protein [Candidatus Brocadiia bacterium]